MTRKFQDLDSFTIADIHAALLRNNPGELALVSITVAVASPDPDLARQVCVRLSVYDDPKVRGNAIMSLGHVARRFRKLDEKAVRPIIESGLRDVDEYVRVHAQSAADELQQFMGWEFQGHVFGG